MGSRIATIAVVAIVVGAGVLHAQNSNDGWTGARPDGHAPIGVMGDHTHHAGEFMLGYRFGFMKMDGNLNGSDEVSSSEILSPTGYDFKVAPVQMTMQMHMASIMYAPIDRVTFMAMLPIVSMSMDLTNRVDSTFTTTSSGIGDLGISALVVLARYDRQQIHLNATVDLPTGSITETDVTPMSAPNAAQLPYPMQPGSGTMDIRPGLTWLGQTDDWSWGIQGIGTVRFGENDHSYRLGNAFDATAWGARKICSCFSASVRLAMSDWGDVEGMDTSLVGAVAMKMVPTAFPNLRGGSRVDAGIGGNVVLPVGPLNDLRFGAEGIVPIYQSLHGPQLKRSWKIVVGSQFAW